MASSVDISRARILEIGGSYFKLEYPERTTSLWSMPRLPQEGEPIDGFSTPGQVLRELKDAREGKYDVVVANTLRYSPWHPRYWARGPFYTPTRPWASLTRTLRELNALLAQHAAAAEDDDDMPKDIDAFRFELARRIMAWVESRRGEAGAPPAETAAAGGEAGGPFSGE